MLGKGLELIKMEKGVWDYWTVCAVGAPCRQVEHRKDVMLDQRALFHLAFADGLRAITAWCCFATCCNRSRGGP